MEHDYEHAVFYLPDEHGDVKPYTRFDNSDISYKLQQYEIKNPVVREIRQYMSDILLSDSSLSETDAKDICAINMKVSRKTVEQFSCVDSIRFPNHIHLEKREDGKSKEKVSTELLSQLTQKPVCSFYVLLDHDEVIMYHTDKYGRTVILYEGTDEFRRQFDPNSGELLDTSNNRLYFGEAAKRKYKESQSFIYKFNAAMENSPFHTAYSIGVFGLDLFVNDRVIYLNFLLNAFISEQLCRVLINPHFRHIFEWSQPVILTLCMCLFWLTFCIAMVSRDEYSMDQLTACGTALGILFCVLSLVISVYFTKWDEISSIKQWSVELSKMLFSAGILPGYALFNIKFLTRLREFAIAQLIPEQSQ